MSHSSAGTSVVKYSEGERLLREAMPLRKAWAVRVRVQAGCTGLQAG